LGGRRDRRIRINVRPERMAAYNIVAQDLITAFENEHVQLPGGFLVGNKAEHLLKRDLEYHNLHDLGEMVISYRDDAPIKRKDVAVLEDGLEDQRQIAHHNGKPTVGVGIIKVTHANTVAIIADVKRRLDEDIRPNLPPGMSIDISTDDSIF